ncbi:RepB family protein [Enterococcus sp. AZ196]|uniref:RepB family protein n=1 Tax=Enterococcus sp. AZ196 TaxID=2774659 RepID=UPI003D2A2631
MVDKFNAFDEAQKKAPELLSRENKASKVNSSAQTNKRRETKKQMSLMFTPTHKDKLNQLAKQEGISVSELIAEWIDEH